MEWRDAQIGQRLTGSAPRDFREGVKEDWTDLLCPDRVSVVIPAYNVAEFITEALESVFAQTRPAFEVIVVNDGSPDTEKLEATLHPFTDRVRYIRQENRGLSGARNTGIRAASGDFIALLDGDDLWTPHYIETQTNFLRQNPQYDLVYCDAIFFGDAEYRGKRYMSVCPSSGEATSAALLSRTCSVFVSVMARGEVLRNLSFDESLRSCEDFDCWLRLTASGRRIGYHRDVLVRYRRREASLSANPLWMAEWHLRVLDKCTAIWPPHTPEGRLLKRAKSRKAAELASLRGKDFLRAGDVDAALVQFKKALRNEWSTRKAALCVVLHLAPRLIRMLSKLRRLLIPEHTLG